MSEHIDFEKWFAQLDLKATKVTKEEIKHWAAKAWFAATVQPDSPVPKDWVDGAEMTVAQWGQREYDSGRIVGVKNGLEQAASAVMERALDLFTEKKDEDAKKLRAIAEDLKQKTK